MKRTIGSFLFSRLRDAGIRHVIGVPGDYNLPLLAQIEEVDGIEFVGACNELNAAYAADGNARVNGISALLTTYGVGELSAINGVAGSCAEHVPVVCITGAPPMHAAAQRMLLHHTLGDGNFDNTIACFREFTAAQARLTPANAADEVDRVLRACVREQRPVYLQVPSDITHLEIDVDPRPLEFPEETSEPERLAAAVERISTMLSNAERPALLLDMDAGRFGLSDALMELVGRAQIPFATLGTGKCALDESHPLFLGIYAGQGSASPVRERIERSDCLIAIAPRFIDTNSLWFSQKLPPSTAYVNPYNVAIGRDVYESVSARHVIPSVARSARSRGTDEKKSVAKRSAGPSTTAHESAYARDDKGDGSALSQQVFWGRVAGFFREGDVVLAETGTSRVALTGMRMPRGTTFISQGLWGSIGYTLPALLGSLLAAPHRRQLLFIGDGSFQLTAQELSTILAWHFKPIIFLLNNGGYTVERMILGEESSHNDVALWDYAKLVSALAPESDCLALRISTRTELQRAMEVLEHETRAALVEVVLHYLDAPEMLKRAGKLLAEFEYGPRGPQRLQTTGAVP
jgi:indolepyruvate decarboxylase